MQINVNDVDYELLIGYQKDDNRRKAFNQLVAKTFPCSFEPWYEGRYWNDKYIPYTLFDGENAVANVSVNKMNFVVMGEPKFYIQIGTVMTDDAYKNQGLSRFLMEYVLVEWETRCDLVYLYANKT